jgi:hypothetical protein
MFHIMFKNLIGGTILIQAGVLCLWNGAGFTYLCQYKENNF